jgi:hypothetical protein
MRKEFPESRGAALRENQAEETWNWDAARPQAICTAGSLKLPRGDIGRGIGDNQFGIAHPNERNEHSYAGRRGMFEAARHTR